jgi:hypothetical protein
MSLSTFRLAAVVASVLLGSCLGGGGADDAIGDLTGACDSITGGDATITTNTADGCFGCTVANLNQAADGDLATSASVTVPLSFAGQGVSIKATAQAGIIYASGQQAGVFFKVPASSGLANPQLAVTIRTFLAGTAQNPPTTYATTDVGGGMLFKSFKTSDVFDAVEVMVSNTQAASMPFEIHEICSNSNVQ